MSESAMGLLDALLDSWDRNNRILIGLLSVVPDEAFDVSALDGTMTIQKMFTHIPLRCSI